MKRIVIATHNTGKLAEIRALLAPFEMDASCSTDYNLAEPEETGATFAENAEIKARYTTEKTGLPSLADDSGLSVAALNGAPGIYSARWAGEDKNFTRAMQRIENELIEKNTPTSQFHAAFICDLCLCLPNGNVQHFEGKVSGMLTFPARGTQGFGYDPIFIPESETRTFAEIAATEKQTMSHRARAFARFVDALKMMNISAE